MGVEFATAKPPKLLVVFQLFLRSPSVVKKVYSLFYSSLFCAVQEKTKESVLIARKQWYILSSYIVYTTIMQRMLFTIPDHIATALREEVPEGERSKFVISYIEIPLRKLKNKKKKKKKEKSMKDIYKPSFLRDLRKAERQAARGEVYSHEEIMKEFGLL